MVKIIERVLRLLVRVAGFKVQEIVYVGRGISLNDFYKQGHWRTRHNIKKKYSQILGEVIEKANLDFCDEFALIVFYNSLHDPDNVVGMTKVFVDCLKGNDFCGKYITEDDKRYYKMCGVIPDTSLEKNTFKFILISNK